MDDCRRDVGPGGAIALFVVGRTFWPWLAGAVLLGVGTALVYPTLLAAVSDRSHPDWRATAVGVYRFWRDGAMPSALRCPVRW